MVRLTQAVETAWHGGPRAPRPVQSETARCLSAGRSAFASSSTERQRLGATGALLPLFLLSTASQPGRPSLRRCRRYHGSHRERSVGEGARSVPKPIEL